MEAAIRTERNRKAAERGERSERRATDVTAAIQYLKDELQLVQNELMPIYREKQLESADALVFVRDAVEHFIMGQTKLREQLWHPDTARNFNEDKLRLFQNQVLAIFRQLLAVPWEEQPVPRPWKAMTHLANMITFLNSFSFEGPDRVLTVRMPATTQIATTASLAEITEYLRATGVKSTENAVALLRDLQRAGLIPYATLWDKQEAARLGVDVERATAADDFEGLLLDEAIISEVNLGAFINNTAFSAHKVFQFKTVAERNAAPQSQRDLGTTTAEELESFALEYIAGKLGITVNALLEPRVAELKQADQKRYSGLDVAKFQQMRRSGEIFISGLEVKDLRAFLELAREKGLVDDVNAFMRLALSTTGVVFLEDVEKFFEEAYKAGLIVFESAVERRIAIQKAMIARAELHQFPTEIGTAQSFGRSAQRTELRELTEGIILSSAQVVNILTDTAEQLVERELSTSADKVSQLAREIQKNPASFRQTSRSGWGDLVNQRISITSVRTLFLQLYDEAVQAFAGAIAAVNQARAVAQEKLDEFPEATSSTVAPAGNQRDILQREKWQRVVNELTALAGLLQRGKIEELPKTDHDWLMALNQGSGLEVDHDGYTLLLEAVNAQASQARAELRSAEQPRAKDVQVALRLIEQYAGNILPDVRQAAHQHSFDLQTSPDNLPKAVQFIQEQITDKMLQTHNMLELKKQMGLTVFQNVMTQVRVGSYGEALAALQSFDLAQVKRLGLADQFESNIAETIAILQALPRSELRMEQVAVWNLERGLKNAETALKTLGLWEIAGQPSSFAMQIQTERTLDTLRRAWDAISPALWSHPNKPAEILRQLGRNPDLDKTEVEVIEEIRAMILGTSSELRDVEKPKGIRAIVDRLDTMLAELNEEFHYQPPGPEKEMMEHLGFASLTIRKFIEEGLGTAEVLKSASRMIANALKVVEAHDGLELYREQITAIRRDLDQAIPGIDSMLKQRRSALAQREAELLTQRVRPLLVGWVGGRSELRLQEQHPTVTGLVDLKDQISAIGVNQSERETVVQAATLVEKAAQDVHVYVTESLGPDITRLRAALLELRKAHDILVPIARSEITAQLRTYGDVLSGMIRDLGRSELRLDSKTVALQTNYRQYLTHLRNYIYSVAGKLGLNESKKIEALEKLGEKIEDASDAVSFYGTQPDVHYTHRPESVVLGLNTTLNNFFQDVTVPLIDARNELGSFNNEELDVRLLAAIQISAVFASAILTDLLRILITTVTGDRLREPMQDASTFLEASRGRLAETEIPMEGDFSSMKELLTNITKWYLEPAFKAIKVIGVISLTREHTRFQGGLSSTDLQVALETILRAMEGKPPKSFEEIAAEFNRIEIFKAPTGERLAKRYAKFEAGRRHGDVWKALRLAREVFPAPNERSGRHEEFSTLDRHFKEIQRYLSSDTDLHGYHFLDTAIGEIRALLIDELCTGLPNFDEAIPHLKQAIEVMEDIKKARSELRAQVQPDEREVIQKLNALKAQFDEASPIFKQALVFDHQHLRYFDNQVGPALGILLNVIGRTPLVWTHQEKTEVLSHLRNALEHVEERFSASSNKTRRMEILNQLIQGVENIPIVRFLEGTKFDGVRGLIQEVLEAIGPVNKSMPEQLRDWAPGLQTALENLSGDTVEASLATAAKTLLNTAVNSATQHKELGPYVDQISQALEQLDSVMSSRSELRSSHAVEMTRARLYEGVQQIDGAQLSDARKMIREVRLAISSNDEAQIDRMLLRAYENLDRDEVYVSLVTAAQLLLELAIKKADLYPRTKEYAVQLTQARDAVESVLARSELRMTMDDVWRDQMWHDILHSPSNRFEMVKNLATNPRYGFDTYRLMSVLEVLRPAIDIPTSLLDWSGGERVRLETGPEVYLSPIMLFIREKLAEEEMIAQIRAIPQEWIQEVLKKSALNTTPFAWEKDHFAIMKLLRKLGIEIPKHLRSQYHSLWIDNWKGMQGHVTRTHLALAVLRAFENPAWVYDREVTEEDERHNEQFLARAELREGRVQLPDVQVTYDKTAGITIVIEGKDGFTAGNMNEVADALTIRGIGHKVEALSPTQLSFQGTGNSKVSVIDMASGSWEDFLMREIRTAILNQNYQYNVPGRAELRVKGRGEGHVGAAQNAEVPGAFDILERTQPKEEIPQGRRGSVGPVETAAETTERAELRSVKVAGIPETLIPFSIKVFGLDVRGGDTFEDYQQFLLQEIRQNIIPLFIQMGVLEKYDEAAAQDILQALVSVLTGRPVGVPTEVADIFQILEGTESEVVVDVTEQYLAEIAARFSQVSPEALGSMVVDYHQLLSQLKASDLLNLFRILETIQQATGAPFKPLLTVVGGEADILRQMQALLTNRDNGITSSGERQLARNFAQNISQYVKVVETPSSMTLLQAVNQQVTGQEGIGTLFAEALVGLQSDLNFVLRDVSKHSPAVPFLVEKLIETATFTRGLKLRSGEQFQALLQAHLLKDNPIEVFSRIVSGRAFFEIHSMERFVESLKAQLRVRIMA
ncbi:MAG: hypothetical protein JW893_03360 [Candidatus Omnitrophica bacterium]|nr:hypothetical protein [Candidatus Omnitrophota bacterium]